jgi:hypothetical protein
VRTALQRPRRRLSTATTTGFRRGLHE